VSAVKFIGNEINRTGERIAMIPRDFFALIGAPSPALAADLLNELQRRGIVDCIESAAIGMPTMFQEVNLTLSGWETYERERKGKTSGSYGFLAMKFGDPLLDPLARDIIKPALKAELSFDLFDMRDVARAGVIDNLMRAQIRDAAFVIVDLTHDNSGAYWEAGYAEGLGKPVIYICEKGKFDAARTHFDTNHCTTVVWESMDTGAFVQQLVATLRRSLNLF